MDVHSFVGQGPGQEAGDDLRGPARAEAAPERVWGRRLRQVYLWAVFGLLLFGGATFVLKSFHDVHYPFQWDDDEGNMWWEAAHATHLREGYHLLQQFPYIVNAYPPGWHLVTWAGARITGDYLVAGRLVSAVSGLGISLLLGFLVFRASPRRISARIRGAGALLTALLCFRVDSLGRYIPRLGVDLLAVFLTLLGVFLFLRSRSKPAGHYAAFAVFVVAVFTKQTMIAAPLACLIACALISPGAALKRLLFCLTLGSGVLGCLAWATDGEILRHLFFYNLRQPFSLAHWINGMQENVIGMLPIASLACLALLPFLYHLTSPKGGSLLRWLRAGVESSPYRQALLVLGLELVLALLISVTYGKLGSWIHYFLEWNLVCCPLAGLVLVRALAGWRPTSRYTPGGAALFLLLFLAALTGLPDSLRRINQVFVLSPGERYVQQVRRSSAAAVLEIIKATPGPVWCENMLLVMQAGKQIPIEPGMLCYLAKAGVWDQSGFVGLITGRKFGVIVLRNLDNPFWTTAIAHAVRECYAPAERLGDPGVENGYYTVYRPLPECAKP
jgi:hypothetical protein